MRNPSLTRLGRVKTLGRSDAGRLRRLPTRKQRLLD